MAISVMLKNGLMFFRDLKTCSEEIGHLLLCFTLEGFQKLNMALELKLLFQSIHHTARLVYEALLTCCPKKPCSYLWGHHKIPSYAVKKKQENEQSVKNCLLEQDYCENSKTKTVRCSLMTYALGYSS